MVHDSTTVSVNPEYITPDGAPSTTTTTRRRPRQAAVRAPAAHDPAELVRCSRVNGPQEN
jgi:hypothetical protein